MIIIGARPSIGKTALALSMAQHIAVDKKIPVAFFSLEMPDIQIMLRLFAQEARIPSEKIRNGMLKKDQLFKLQEAAGRIYEAPLYLVDAPNMKLLDLRAMARRMKTTLDVKIIFIDYLGLITNENTQIPRYEQISEISRSLKSLARELKIPVVILSQVSRASEGNVPSLADLRDSGAIEQDADVVMFLHRNRETPNDGEEVQDAVETELILAKQRNGPTGTMKLMYIKPYTKFENMAKHE